MFPVYRLCQAEYSLCCSHVTSQRLDNAGKWCSACHRMQVAVMALLSRGNGRRRAGLYDRGMDDTHTETRAQMAELEEVIAVLQTEQQWLERLRRAAQDYLDRPNAATRGKLNRLLEAVQRHVAAQWGAIEG